MANQQGSRKDHGTPGLQPISTELQKYRLLTRALQKAFTEP
jgi:hypothetical protein